jgi:hypothetical protein
MTRSPLLTVIARTLRIARFCDDHRLSTTEGLAAGRPQLQLRGGADGSST